MRIKSKLLLFFILVSLLPAVFLTTWIVSFYRNLLYQQTSQNELLVVAEKARFLEESFWNLKRDLNIISRFPPIQGIIRSEETGIDELDQSTAQQWRDRLNQLFVSIVNDRPSMMQIRYIKANGDELVRVDRRSSQIHVVGLDQLQNKSHRPYFKEIIKNKVGEFVATEISLNKENDKVTYPLQEMQRFGMPIADERTGKVYGALVVNINSRLFLKDMFRNVSNSDSRKYFVVNEKGDFLYYPLKKLGFQYLIDKDVPKAFDLYPELYDVVLENSSGFFHDKDKNSFITWEKIKIGNGDFRPGWTFFSENDEDNVFGPMEDMNTLAIAAILIFVFVSSVIGSIFGRRITGPLSDLTETAQLISEGQRDVDIVIPDRQDEVHDLALAFSNMMKNLNLADARVSSVFKTAKDAIIVFDQYGVIRFANPAVLPIFGYTTNELIEQSVGLIFSSKNAEGDKFTIEDIGLAGLVEQGSYKELVSVKKDGVKFPVMISVSEFYLEGQRNFTCVIRDITELKEKELELKRINKELEQFTYVASHDLREPLRKIQSFGDLLLEDFAGGLSSEGQKCVNTMRDSAKRMADLISDLLKYSRVQRLNDPFENVDLNEVAREALSDLEVSIIESGAKIELGKLPIIHGNKIQMAQLFGNLIGNAIKYVPKDRKPQLRISFEDDVERFRLVFSDNGIGVPAEHQKKIFEPFRRLHTREEYQGTGIGLSICYQIVLKHGGRLFVESENEEGSRFIAEFPSEVKVL